MKILLFVLAASLIFIPPASTEPYPSHTLNIKLTLNKTGTIYIPGIGEVPPQSGTYTTPPHYYMASYPPLKALVFSQQTPVSLQTAANATHHTLRINQNITNTQVFLVFTKGDYKTIESRMPLIEDSSFLSGISPSFYYPPAPLNPVKIALNYSSIDIQNTLVLRKGVHEISFESNKTGGSKILIVREE